MNLLFTIIFSILLVIGVIKFDLLLFKIITILSVIFLILVLVYFE